VRSPQHGSMKPIDTETETVRVNDMCSVTSEDSASEVQMVQIRALWFIIRTSLEGFDGPRFVFTKKLLIEQVTGKA
jgi:hypothetical protein